MSVYQVKTFADIIAAIREEAQIQSTDTTAINRIKRDLNATYAEITAQQRWYWLNGTCDLTLPAYFASDTATVTQGSATVELVTAPGPSKAGHRFSVDGYNEIYRIESHDAGSTTLKLATEFTGTTNSSATFKIWSDSLPLPTDCKETVEVWHDHYNQPLDNVGRQEYRRIVQMGAKTEGYPQKYYTGDYVDPAQTSAITSLPAVSTRASAGTRKTIKFASSLPSAVVAKITAGAPVRWRISAANDSSYNGEFYISTVSTTTNANDTVTFTGTAALQESAVADSSMTIVNLDQSQDYDRYRELFLFPCLYTSKTTIHVDYIRDCIPLEDDADEPLIPYEYRMVLVYGGLYRLYARMSNETKMTLNRQLYEGMLARMMGKLQDSHDIGSLRPSKLYLSAKRGPSRRRPPSSGSLSTGSGGGGQVVTGTPSTVAIFNASGELAASTTVSLTELNTLDGIDSNIQDQLDAHLADTVDAHDASTISNSPSGNLAATDVQAALDELQTDVDTRATSAALTDHINDTTDAHAGSAITNTPSGNLAATTVQAALDELQTDVDTRAPKASPTFTGTVTTPLTTAGPVLTSAGGVLSSEAQLAVARGGTNSGAPLNNNRVMQSSGGSIVEAAAITASRALKSDANGIPTHSVVTDTEQDYLSGVTSAIQTQLDAKVAKSTLTTKGDLYVATASATIARQGIGTNGQVLVADSSQTNGLKWGNVQGGINYLSGDDSNAEASVGTWAAYADAAGSSPVDGTGGSPTTTWTRTTSSPLRGTGSFLLTKDAANRQGEGAAVAWTPDAADYAKPICVSFDYTVASGTYADGDLTVYLYDVTNSTVIQPAPYTILSAATGLSQKWIGYFQTSATGASYRLIVHVASTSASAYTVKFDNFNVGPTYQSYGAVQGDEVSTSMTPNGVGTVSSTSYWVKRIGDKAFFRGYFKCGTVAASTFSVSLPAGYVIDSAKLASTTNAQTVGWGDRIRTGASGGPDKYYAFYDGSDTAKIYFSGASASDQFTKQNGSTAFANSDGFTFEFAVPITGWSSNVQVSSDADTRVVAATAITQAPSGTPSGSFTVAKFTMTNDSHAAYSASTGLYTVPCSGWYTLNGCIEMTATLTVNQYVAVALYKNGSTYDYQYTKAGGSMSRLIAGYSFQVYANAGDTLGIYAASNGSSLSYSTSDSGSNLYIHRLSGPAQIAASEKVRLKYQNTAGTSITSSLADVPFATKLYDSHGAFNGTTFTAPRADVYRISGRLVSQAVNNSTSNVFQFTVVVTSTPEGASGRTDYMDWRWGDGVSHTRILSGGNSYYLNAGDTLKIQASNSNTVSLDTTAGYNTICIESQGGV